MAPPAPELELPRPKREIHAPARDPYFTSEADMMAIQGGAVPGVKSRTGRVSGKAAQEQLRFCKEVIKEMHKKVHEAYAYPFYHPVGRSSPSSEVSRVA